MKTAANGEAANLDGVRVIEIADEQAEYVGQILAGLGAEVIKVESPAGSPTRRIGPFYEDVEDPERSLFFWHYNRGKKSVVADLSTPAGRAWLRELALKADVLIDSTPKGYLASVGIDAEQLRAEHPGLIVARVSPFGDEGPWANYKGSDLVHLALGGEMMNCGYDPEPGGHYDLPPIAPQMWHAYHIAGEQLAMGIIAALFHMRRTGEGQILSCAVHEAVAKATELDLMSWVMRRAPIYRQTCRHAYETVSQVPSIAQTKDGHWFMMMTLGGRDNEKIATFLNRYGMAADLEQRLKEEGMGAESGGRPIPGSSAATELQTHIQDVFQRFVRKFSYDSFPWEEAQQAGLLCVPLRRPHENAQDPHWQKRGTFAEVEYPELGRSFADVCSKWLSNETPWRIGRRAPRLGEDTTEVRNLLAKEPLRGPRKARSSVTLTKRSRWGKPFALDGIRVLDFTWFLASAGGTRFLSALGAECIKVEWKAHPDTRLGAQAPVGGREARAKATAPLQGIVDNDMGGQFNNKNPGKRGLSLNVRDPRGLEIARQLVAMSDIVAEGFSPGVMESWGMGYDALRAIKPNIIYAQQSGMGTAGTYGRFRAVGPIAQAISGVSDMSGLPEPAMPAGWGYSYLDWIGAFSFSTAMLAALHYREMTGRGQWIDASQCEAGIYVGGTSFLDWFANGRTYQRSGNRSPYKPAAPHGAYRTKGEDRWLAIACFTEEEWASLTRVFGREMWRGDPRFSTLAARLMHQDELDAELSAWLCDKDGYDVMHALQAAGVAAGVCQTAQDRVDGDPQLAALGWLTEVTGTKIGTWPVAEFPIHLSETPAFIGGTIDRGAPCYGEDNEYVLGELLGMAASEIRNLEQEGVI